MSIRFIALLLVFVHMCNAQEIFIDITSDCLPTNGVAAASSVVSILSNEISAFENIVYSQIEALSAFDTICTATAVGTQRTINTAGIYCLSADVSGLITVAANNVTFNLNGHTITGGISISPNVTNGVIYNGNIKTGSSGNGILIQSGCSAIEVNGVEITGATYGIQATSASNCIIKNCLVRENSYGIYCSSCSGMQIQNTQADSNTNVGFDLVSSSLNVVTDCAALATGKGNITTTNNTIVGFLSSNGSSNIFERCIANGTQGLYSIDQASIVAGFALEGTEAHTKIINSESANAIANGKGVTVPTGILLQNSLSSVATVATLYGTVTTIYAVEWSPDGQYLAVGSDTNTTGNLQILSFNRVNQTFTVVAEAFPYSANGTVYAINWSPDGQYLAVGGLNLASQAGTDLQILNFNRTNNTLVAVAGAFSKTSTVLAVSWSPDGQYLAMGGQSLSSGKLFQVFSFNRVTYALTSVAGDLTGTSINAVHWSPDENYIAVGGAQITGGGYNSTDGLQIYSFSRATNTLTALASAIFQVNSAAIVSSVKWHPNGQCLAVGCGDNQNSSYSNLFVIFVFDRTNNALSQITSAWSSSSTAYVYHVAWTADGTYVSIGGRFFSASTNTEIWKFTIAPPSLSQVYAGSYFFGHVTFASQWSPDGQYLVFAGTGVSTGNVIVFTGLNFPSQNVISGNTVYCNGQSVVTTFTGAVGVGISGSSVSNMIIGNTAYNNPPISSNFFVPSNYQFVTNVFNQLFGEAPSELQNISLNGNTPITQFTDPVVIGQQIYAELTATSGLLNYLSTLQNQLAGACVPQTLSAAGTISQSGTYCLSKSITGTITIAANDVVLSLNNYKVVGSIVVNSNQTDVTIENGVVDANGGTNGILINSGASNITISSMTVKNATLGVQFNSVAGATVQSCTFLSNTTGMQLQNSSNVSVFSSNAVHNKDAGFDLLSSTTNSFFDCQALATGQGNTTITNNFVAGFTSYNGYGNIFERCIANGTQALSTTDSSSVVAGFVLRGTEGCTKIINSESANAITSSSGVTIPYGILLQGSMSNLSGVTGFFSSSEPINAVNWSPDGLYVALGGQFLVSGLATQVQILSFNRVSQSFSLTAVAGTLSSGTIQTLNWSPDGQYLAVGGISITSGLGNDVQILQFNRTNNTLTAVAGSFTSSELISSVNWSSDGLYLAIAGGSLVSNFGTDVQVLSFNRVNNSLTAVSGAFPQATNSSVKSVNWSPDGQYLAVGGIGLTSGFATLFQILTFNRTNNTLTPVAGALATGTFVLSVNWSPDGQYVAIGGKSLTSGLATDVQIFTFNRITNALTPVAGALPQASNNTVNSVNWSSDGQYLAMGGQGIASSLATNVQIFEFDRSTNSLTAVAGALSGSNSFYAILSVNWSPDGQDVLVGGFNVPFGFGTDMQIFTGIQFPSQNVISGNTVYCNGQTVSTTFTGAVGVGISGSSIGNMIIGNTAYDNPPVSSNFFVPSNYYFVTNVFNQLFGQAPSSIQNISLNGNTPITQITDPVWLLQQLQADLYSITNVLATFNNAASLICAPTPVTVAKTLSAAGVYCLSTNITGLITIAASNITLDLNGYTITGGIAVNSGVTNVTMKNGRVLNGSGGDGILVNAGAAQITVQDVRVKSATRGIHFTGVSNSYISNCQVSLNTTGIQLQSSSNIEIGDTIATQNVQAGFELLNSATCFVYGCKAAQTGTGNTNSSGNQSFVYGFVANNTVNTVFKDCIANNTKNTNATSWQTKVAGFALLGTGTQCNAIIGCESANGQTSSSGTCVPYGILLQGSTLSQVSTVTGTFSTLQQIKAIDWSPNGQYLAIGGNSITDGSANQVQIFSLDRNSSSLTRLAGAIPTVGTSNTIAFIKWSPNGQFVAVPLSQTSGTFSALQVYRFYAQNNSFQLVAQALSQSTSGGADAIDWSPDGRFIVIGGSNFPAPTKPLTVFQFNDVSYQLYNFASLYTGGTVGSCRWSPDGNYIAVGGTSLAGSGTSTSFQVLQFVRSANTLTTVANRNVAIGTVLALAWSPDGNYIAIGILTGSAEGSLQVFSFNKLTNALTQVASALTTGPNIFGLTWSPDGLYIATFGQNQIVGGNFFRVWQFDRSLNMLTQVAGAIPTGNIGIAVAWSPDGSYIAIGGVGLTSGLNLDLQIFTGLSFPSGNVITNNTVYCNSMTFTSGVNPYGTGISGSSILNQIIQNDSFNNAANYVFAQNVFNPVYLGGPTLMQNDSVSQNVPLPQVQSINAALTRARLYLYSIVDSRL